MKIDIAQHDSEEKIPVDISSQKMGKIDTFLLPVSIIVEKHSFLHIGASPSPLTEKKGAVFKVDRIPVIPASSFKGALRNQLELLFSAEKESLATLFGLPQNKQRLLKPCIPSSKRSEAERDLEGYRSEYCQIQIKKDKTDVSRSGLCPVCYFMGAAGIMGCLRIPNFFPQARQENLIVDHTNLRIDRKLGTKVDRALVTTEQVKPGAEFGGIIEIVNSTPVGFEFGHPRKISDNAIDLWLNEWQEQDDEARKRILLERILIPALQNVRKLGGHKSKGGGNVRVSVSG